MQSFQAPSCASRALNTVLILSLLGCAGAPAREPASSPATPVSPEQLLRDLAQADRVNGGEPRDFVIQPTSQTCHSAHYSLPELRLRPGQSVYFAVPHGMQREPVSFVILGHRQDPNEGNNRGLVKPMRDNKPGLTSVQLHSSLEGAPDPWRYWGGPASGERGAKFAEIRPRAELENLYSWQHYGHAGVQTGKRSRNPLYADAIRVVISGEDDVYFSQLGIKTVPPRAESYEERIFTSGTAFGDPETEEGRRFGGGQTAGGRFPGALALDPRSRRGASVQLPEGWRYARGEVSIPLTAGRELQSVQIACGDTHPDGVRNTDGGIGTQGAGKISIGLRNSRGEVTWFVERENVAPQEVLTAFPAACRNVIETGDELVIRSDRDTTYVMGVRIGTNPASAERTPASAAPSAPSMSRAPSSSPSLPLSDRCGGMMLEARRAAFNIPVTLSRVTDLEPALNAISDGVVGSLQIMLGALSREEQEIVEQVRRFGVPVVNRLPFENLRSVLASRALLSPDELARREVGARPRVRTPQVEDILFGGRDCVFATVGPPHGFDRYGNVITRFKPHPRPTGWGTPTSGFGYVTRVRNNSTGTPTVDDRLAFSMNVVADADYEDYFGLAIVSYLRQSGGEGARLRSELATERDGERFWATVADKRLGYLEGRYESAMPLEEIESIEVPRDRLREVLGWSEAAPYRDKIKAY